MPSKISESLEPERLARKDTLLQGEVAAGSLNRIAKYCQSEDRPVHYELHFYRNMDGKSCIEGSVSTEVDLQCQRCLQDYKQTLEANVSLMLVKTVEQAREIPESYDPLVMTEYKNIHQVIEDELLLVIPPFPRHDENACETKMLSTAEQEQEEQNELPSGPFADLVSLKQKDRSN